MLQTSAICVPEEYSLVIIAKAVFRKLTTDQNVSDNWKIDTVTMVTEEIGNSLSIWAVLHKEVLLCSGATWPHTLLK